MLTDQPRAGSTRQFCTRAMSRLGNTLSSKPGRDSHGLYCSGVAEEPHLMVPAAVPAFLLFSPVRPRPLVRTGERRPRESRRSPGRAAEGTKPGSSSQLHLWDTSRKTDVPCTRVLLVPGLDSSALGLRLPRTVSALSDHHCFPALPFYRATLLPEQFLSHCFLAWVPVWKRG